MKSSLDAMAPLNEPVKVDLEPDVEKCEVLLDSTDPGEFSAVKNRRERLENTGQNSRIIDSACFCVFEMNCWMCIYVVQVRT